MMSASIVGVGPGVISGWLLGGQITVLYFRYKYKGHSSARCNQWLVG